MPISLRTHVKSNKKILIEELIILTQIIFIDIILAADNAIIIGLIAANFVPKNRKQIILWGVAGALATYMASYIQKHIWIAYVGLGFILIVAIQLIIGGLEDLEILNINEQFKKYF